MSTGITRCKKCGKIMTLQFVWVGMQARLIGVCINPKCEDYDKKYNNFINWDEMRLVKRK